MNFKSLVTLISAGVPLVLPACGGGGATTTAVSSCGLPVPAATFTLGDEVSGCVATADGTHADVHAFTVPAVAAGGDAQFQIVDVTAETVRATLYGPDNSMIGAFTAADPGAALVFHLAAAGGLTYRLLIDDGGGFTAPYSYRLISTFSPIADTFEPNDTPDKAATITMGTPAAAFLFAGAASMTAADAAWEDYYQVSVTGAQAATIRIDDVPTDLAVRLFLYRADQSEIARISTGHKGESLVMQTPIALDPGQYLVRVAPWTDLPAAMSVGADPPDHFTRSYQLTVTQP